MVTDLLIWDDCPFSLPSAIEVRRGITPYGGEIIIFWNPERQTHIDISADKELSQGDLDHIVQSLS
jgi:hypothetical protein